MKFRDPKTGEVFEDIEKARTKFCTGKCSKCALNNYVSLFNCREYYSDSPAEAARRMGYEAVEDEEKPMEKKDKPRIAWDKIGPGTVVWCKTEEGAKVFLSAAEEKGLKWNGGYMPMAYTLWGEYEEDTCYQVESDELSFANYNYCEEEGYTILPLVELLEPVKPHICERLGVEVGERFHIRGRKDVYPEDTVYWITQVGHYSTEPDRAVGSSYAILDVLEDPDRIIRKHRFTEEEITLAGILHRRGGTELYRKEGHGLYWRGETDHGRLPMDLFSSIKVGETVKVEEVMEGSAAGKEQQK